jgi:hypothetical protein
MRLSGPGDIGLLAWKYISISWIARLAGLDAGAARHRAGIEGLAAERATGIGPAQRRHVEGRDTPPASSASGVAVERLAGLAGL